MSRLVFRLQSIPAAAGSRVRVDTASGSNSPADIRTLGGGPIDGSIIMSRSEQGHLPTVLGPDGVTTLYQKTLDYRGQPTGSPVTLTGEDDSPSSGVQSGTYAPLNGSAPFVGSVTIKSSAAGGDDDGAAGHFDSTSRLNLESYQRANANTLGEVVRIFARKYDSKQMIAWYMPSGGWDANGDPIGNYHPVTWIGTHDQANDHASRHMHWEVEFPDTTGALQGRLEFAYGNRTTGTIGVDQGNWITNLSDFTVRTTNGQVLRLAATNASEKVIEFSNDADGTVPFRRWRLRTTNETETGTNAGSNFQLVRYDDTGTLLDTPVVVSRSTGGVTLAGGFVAIKTAGSSVVNVRINTTSLGGGSGVLAIGNVTTAPASNPTAGGVVYVEAGALKYRGSSGTVTTLGPA